MQKNLTELVFILDKSGSMYRRTADTIGGFNSMIAEQKQEEGQAIVSTILFSDTSQVLHDRKDLDEIEELTAKDYVAAGNTAMYDAIGDSPSTRCLLLPPTAWKMPAGSTPAKK